MQDTTTLKRTFVLDPPTAIPHMTGERRARTFDEFVSSLRQLDVLSEAISDKGGDPFIVVKTESLYKAIEFLRNHKDFACNCLNNIAGVDYLPVEAIPASEGKAEVKAVPGRIEVVYVLYSHQHKHQVTIKVYLPRDNPRVASICALYRVANFQERECFDMLGVIFEGHPNHERILCPEDWVGYPLRRDYVYPEEYNGMKVPL